MGDGPAGSVRGSGDAGQGANGVAAVRAALLAELTKIRTVRSTAWTLAIALLLSSGTGVAAGLSTRAFFSRMTAAQRQAFDPLTIAFYGLTVGQLAFVAFAVVAVGGEYASGTIRVSLTAVPRRGLFYCCKILAALAVALAASVVVVPATFAAAQAALGAHGVPVTAPGAPQAMLGACCYLTLICAFCAGVAMALRGTARALAIMLPLLFLDSQGLANVPHLTTVLRYLPDQAGMVVMHLAGPAGDPRFGRPYGPWAGLGIVALWAACGLALGYLRLARADA